MKNLAIAEYFINTAKALLLLTFAKHLFDHTGEVWAITLVFVGEIASAALIPLLIGKYIDEKGVKSTLLFAAIAHPIIAWIGVYYSWQFTTSNYSILFLSVSLSLIWPLIKMCIFIVTPLIDSKELEKNNSLLTFSMQGGQFTGMLLSGWMLFNFSYLTILITASVFFTISMIFYILIPIKKQNIKSKSEDKLNLPSLVKDSKPHLLLITLSQFDFASVAVFNILLASVVSLLFSGNTYWLAGLDAAYACGALLGGLIVAKGIMKRKCSVKDAITTQLFFLAYLTINLIPSAKIALPVAIMFMGFYQSLASIYWRTKMQMEFPPHLIGRLAGIRSLVSSIYIGIVASIVSFSHQYGFNIAITASLLIVTTQIVLIKSQNLISNRILTETESQ